MTNTKTKMGRNISIPYRQVLSLLTTLADAIHRSSNMLTTLARAASSVSQAPLKLKDASAQLLPPIPWVFSPFS